MPKTLLRRLFPHHLKLMVDYNLNPAAIEKLNTISSIKAKRITECGFTANATDHDLIYNNKRRILLTGDFRSIDEKAYPPCEHEGIIILKERRPSPEKIVSCVKAFAQSGYRKDTSHNVIYLWENRAIIHKHFKQVQEIVL